MIANNLTDWKDIANSYFDKAMSLAVLLTLFTFLVTPKIEIKVVQKEVKQMESVDIPPEVKEKIKPPEDIQKPVFDIVIDDNLSGDDAGDITKTVDTIESTNLDASKAALMQGLRGDEGKTPKFVVYEEGPEPIKRVSPQYPDFAKRLAVQGSVVLEVEVLADGHVGAINVVKSLMAGPNGLDEAAKEAVKQWTFQPAKNNGKPVACWVTFPVEFTLTSRK